MLRKTSLAEQAYHELVRQIISGKYPAGTKLTEEFLSGEFGISRTPVREALARLQSEGLVEALPLRGCQVCSFDEQALSELFVCRAQIEVLLLKEAIKRIPAEKIDDLLKNLKEKQQGGRARSLAADESMHNLLIEYSSNRYLRGIAEQLIRRTAPFRHYRNFDEEISEETLTEERRKILEAIKRNDCGDAEKYLSTHIIRGSCL